MPLHSKSDAVSEVESFAKATLILEDWGLVLHLRKGRVADYTPKVGFEIDHILHV